MLLNHQNIVWLASYPKSGNTWFRIFLSNLSSTSTDPININNIHDSVLASSRLQFDELIGTSSSDLSPNEIEELRPKAYKRISELANKNVYVKVHDAWSQTPKGESIFPQDVTKGVIYFIRNPLDVAVSFKYHSAQSFDVIISKMNNDNFSLCQNPQKLLNQLKQVLFDWSKHVESWVDNSKFSVHVIRYEDMLNDTHNTFKSALDFVGEKKTSAEIKNAIQASDFNLLSQMEQEDGFQEKPIQMSSFFRSGKSNQWQKHLSNNNIRRLIDKHGDIMNRFGYNTDSIIKSIS